VFQWKPSDGDPVFSWKHVTLREKVVFQWKPLDDDPVLSWKHATLREKSRVPVDPIARRPRFVLEIRDPPREKSCSGGPHRCGPLKRVSLGNTRPLLEQSRVPRSETTVFSRKYANLREKSRVSLNFVARSSTATVTSTCARAQHQPPSALRGFNDIPIPFPPSCAPFLLARPPCSDRNATGTP